MPFKFDAFKTARLLIYTRETFLSILNNEDNGWQFPVTREPYSKLFDRVLFKESGLVEVYTIPISGKLPMKLEYAQVPTIDGTTALSDVYDDFYER